jgi:hypothetical protein
MYSASYCRFQLQAFKINSYFRNQLYHQQRLKLIGSLQGRYQFLLYCSNQIPKANNPYWLQPFLLLF